LAGFGGPDYQIIRAKESNGTMAGGLLDDAELRRPAGSSVRRSRLASSVRRVRETRHRALAARVPPGDFLGASRMIERLNYAA
jgi:hypothetical protein